MNALRSFWAIIAQGALDSAAAPNGNGLEDAKNPDAAPAARGSGPLGLTGSVGRGGDNDPDDVRAVQKALNKRVGAGLPEDGKCDGKTQKAIEEFQMLLGQFKANGLIEPGRGVVRILASSSKLGPPPERPKPIAPPKLGKPELSTAPKIWHGTRDILATNIAELKKGVLAHYGSEVPEVIQAITESMQKPSVILEKLDHRLADTLAAAQATNDAAERAAELKNAKAILTEYIVYVKSEPMIDQLDSNPFGVDTNLRKVLMDSLTHMAKSIG